MTINKRLELIIKDLGLNNNSFSNTIGVNPTVIHNIVKGRNAPSYDILNKIALSFDNINPEWLLTGNGEMLKSENQNSCCNNCQKLQTELLICRAELIESQKECLRLKDELIGRT